MPTHSLKPTTILRALENIYFLGREQLDEFVRQIYKYLAHSFGPSILLWPSENTAESGVESYISLSSQIPYLELLLCSTNHGNGSLCCNFFSAFSLFRCRPATQFLSRKKKTRLLWKSQISCQSSSTLLHPLPASSSSSPSHCPIQVHHPTRGPNCTPFSHSKEGNSWFNSSLSSAILILIEYNTYLLG